MIVPDIWITAGKDDFFTDIDKIKQFKIKGIRVNTGRSSYSWSYEYIKKIYELGYPLENIYLDIANTKKRLFMQNDIFLDKKTKFKIYKDLDQKYIDTPSLKDNDFFDNISKNDIVYFGDGDIEGIVDEINEECVVIQSMSKGVLRNGVAIGVKGHTAFKFFIDSNEILNVKKILAEYPINLIISFVQNKKNMIWARKEFNNALSIVPKIETIEAVQTIEEIIKLSEQIFIGRGDLALATGIEKIGIYQKILIEKAKKMNCKVAVGTGTLDSLKWSEIPLRAEIVDITNYCLCGVDAIVLTSETGGSENPNKPIEYLRNTLNYLETVNV